MIKCYFDGSYSMATNTAGIGWVVYDEQDAEIESYSECFENTGKMSVNWAEYRALRSLLEYLQYFANDDNIIIHGDSMLVIQQMAGEWRVKGGTYIDEYKKCAGLPINATYVWIPRERNDRADELSKYR